MGRNNSSRERSLLDMKKIQTEHLKELSRIQAEPEVMLKFTIDAWDQIIECRRVLKWSYVYGYYIPEEEHAKEELFEYLQGEAETGLERLHDCAENELWVHLTEKGPSENFNDFRKKLVGLTGVTRTYFENLVRALGNGLSEVNSYTIVASKKRNSKKIPNKYSSSNIVGFLYVCNCFRVLIFR